MPEPKATGAGRGVLYIAFAKFYFLIVGMVTTLRADPGQRPLLYGLRQYASWPGELRSGATPSQIPLAN